MASLTIGKVSIKPRGAYSAGTNYAFLDSVSNLGGAFLCLSPTGSVEPGVTSGWENYWMVLSEGIQSIEISSPETGKASVIITLSNGMKTTATFDTAAIGAGAIGTTELAPGAVTRNTLGSDVKILAFTNQGVAVSAWTADSTYEDYGYSYRAAIALTGVTASFAASVVFAPAEADSGTFASVSNSYAGGVYIYANEIPTGVITIPTIICIPIA